MKSFTPYTAVSQCQMSVTNFACGHLQSLQFKTHTHTHTQNAAIISTKVQLSALSSGWSSGSFPNNVFPRADSPEERVRGSRRPRSQLRGKFACRN